ncbi:MAG: hypothetical protein OH319_02685 [Candidatus Parvarchaeota archaeon]|nr:hypothetical protein [Candidatus Jingweiarchaeum tengchongense]MCW1298275.1 hypothetical protein [Candidatus Jingweiarchaeum tengchongense]MCW1300366.1 hypothetical protein [Candidatus Jingweiarchaeum tengchongense]MCW1304789.1 hypothetical protein [Candidatus Jingweiarchaeum tengchongense]MCW1305379.1 hypothetical protein [Candidatus Jingweiarchaeum tengchongense]
MKVVGINLSPNERMISGVCLIEGLNVSTFSPRTNEQIMEIISRARPEVVAINVPSNLNENKDEMEEFEIRFTRIKNNIERYSEIIKTNNETVKSLLKVDESTDIFKKFNFRRMNIIRNQSEKDAILCALVALFYKEGKYQKLGDEKGGFIFIPLI